MNNSTNPEKDFIEAFNKNIFKKCIYVDIEGFSFLKTQAERRNAYTALLESVYYAIKGEGLFTCMQFGSDGFLIIQDYGGDDFFEKEVMISVKVLQKLLIQGFVGRAHISFGSLLNEYKAIPLKMRPTPDSNILKHGLNIFWYQPFIGDAIINTYKLSGPKGPLLIVDSKLEGIDTFNRDLLFECDGGNFQINWIIYNTILYDSFDESGKTTQDLKDLLKYYIEKHKGLSKNWVESALWLIS